MNETKGKNGELWVMRKWLFYMVVLFDMNEVKEYPEVWWVGACYLEETCDEWRDQRK